MEEQCPICSIPYDLDRHVPMILCSEQHLCCYECTNKLLQNPGTKKYCPECRQEINKRNVVKFRQFIKCVQKLKECKLKLAKQFQDLKRNMLSGYDQAIKELVLVDLQNKSQYEYIKSTAERFVTQQKYELATTLLQAIIEKFPNRLEEIFVGLGSRQEEEGFCEKCSLQWYKNQYNVNSLAAEDILNYISLIHPKYRSQKQWYEQMVGSHPGNFKFVFGLALAEHNADYTEAALQLYQRVIELNPNFNKSYEMIAFIYLSDKKLDLAQKFAKECLRIQPNSIFARFILAHDIISYEQIIKNQPRYVRAVNNLGDIYLDAKDDEKALDLYRTCCRINKHYNQPFLNIGQRQIQLKQEKDAIQILTQTLDKELTPIQSLRCFQLLASAYMNLKKYDESAKWYNKYLSIKPDDKLLQYKLGKVYYQLKKYEESIKIFVSYLNQDEFNAKIFTMIISSYYQLKKPEQAFQWLNRWLRIQPQNLSIWGQLAKYYYARKNWEESLKWCELCLDRGYKKNIFYPIVVDILHAIGQKEAGLKRIGDYLHQCELNNEQYEQIFSKGMYINTGLKPKKPLPYMYV